MLYNTIYTICGACAVCFCCPGTTDRHLEYLALLSLLSYCIWGIPEAMNDVVIARVAEGLREPEGRVEEVVMQEEIVSQLRNGAIAVNGGTIGGFFAPLWHRHSWSIRLSSGLCWIMLVQKSNIIICNIFVILLYTRKSRARRASSSSPAQFPPPGFKDCDAIGSKTRFALQQTSMLLPRLLTSCRNSSNHFSTLPTTSHLLSTLLNDLHLSAHFLDSPPLSFHLSLLFSTLSTRVASPHLSSTCPIFFLSPVEVTQCKLSFSAQLSCRYIRSIRLSRSSCIRLIWNRDASGCHPVPLKHANMSVSSTAAGSPMNNWQPDPRLCRFRTSMPLKHANMSMSSTAAHSTLIASAPKCMKVCCLILICSLHAVTPIRFTNFSCKRHYCSISHAAAGVRNLDAAIQLRSADTSCNTQ